MYIIISIYRFLNQMAPPSHKTHGAGEECKELTSATNCMKKVKKHHTSMGKEKNIKKKEHLEIKK